MVPQKGESWNHLKQRKWPDIKDFYFFLIKEKKTQVSHIQKILAKIFTCMYLIIVLLPSGWTILYVFNLQLLVGWTMSSYISRLMTRTYRLYSFFFFLSSSKTWNNVFVDIYKVMSSLLHVLLLLLVVYARKMTRLNK